MKLTEKELEEIAEEIQDEIDDYVKEQYLDQCNIVVEYDDYQKWLQIEDAPDVQELFDEAFEEAIVDYDLDEEDKEYVKENISVYSEDDLEEIAYDNYND